MDEAAWLASEDPARLLEHVRGKVGDRKLRLWVAANRCAACESVWDDLNWSWADKAAYLAGASCSTPQRKAALLREILGNPFRPVSPGTPKWVLPGGQESRERTPPPWLAWNDGLVRRLAQAAYDERQRQCGRCRGKGRSWFCPGCHGEWLDDVGPDCFVCGRDLTGRACLDCQGKGVIDDGTLDPERLLVLADALEEAGCEEEELLRHLRGEERCPNRYCWGDGCTDAAGGFPVACLCHATPGRILLRGPHVRGCWALDLLLGLDG